MAENQSIDLIPFYPFLYEELFEPETVVFEDEYIAAGQKIALLELEGAGILQFLFLKADTPDLDIIFETDGKSITHNIRSLYEIGLTFPSNNFPFLSRYDTSANIYCFVYDPSFPLSFSRYCHIHAHNRSSSAASFSATISLVKITEKLLEIAKL